MSDTKHAEVLRELVDSYSLAYPEIRAALIAGAEAIDKVAAITRDAEHGLSGALDDVATEAAERCGYRKETSQKIAFVHGYRVGYRARCALSSPREVKIGAATVPVRDGGSDTTANHAETL